MTEEPGRPENRSVLREVDDEARRLARRLVRSARYGALAVLEPDTGMPFASRVAVACDFDGTPTMLISQLSTHTAALGHDARCSLLLGEPGRGDPLAHPRITVLGKALRLAADDPALPRVRSRYLARHPKASLYVDFADFGFFVLHVERASLNGGFGRAYVLAPADVLDAGVDASLAAIETEAIDHMNRDHAEAVSRIATELAGGAPGDWQLVSLDARGCELACDGALHRVEFEQPLESAAGLRSAMATLARRARDAGAT